MEDPIKYMTSKIVVVSDVETDKRILARLVAIELLSTCCHECAFEKAAEKYNELREMIITAIPANEN